MLRETLALSTTWGTYKPQPSLSRLEIPVCGKWRLLAPGMGSWARIPPLHHPSSDPHVSPTCRARGWISLFPRGTRESPLPRQSPPHLHRPWQRKWEDGFVQNTPNVSTLQELDRPIFLAFIFSHFSTNTFPLKNTWKFLGLVFFFFGCWFFGVFFNYPVLGILSLASAWLNSCLWNEELQTAFQLMILFT